MTQGTVIRRYVAKADVPLLIQRLYMRGFDNYTIKPSTLYSNGMEIIIPFDGDVNSSRAETQVEVMFGTIPRHY